MKLKIKLQNHLKVSWFFWLLLLIFLTLLFYLNFDPEAVFVFSIYQLAFSLPALYLHFEYYLRNSGDEVILSKDRLILTKKNGTSLKTRVEDIVEVVLYKSASADKGGIPLSAMEVYHYARIVTKTQGDIIITCLLAPDVALVLKTISGMRFVRKKRAFCTTFWK